MRIRERRYQPHSPDEDTQAVRSPSWSLGFTIGTDICDDSRTQFLEHGLEYSKNGLTISGLV